MFLLYSFQNVTGYFTLCRRVSFGGVSSPSPCLSELPGITLSVFSPGDTVVHEAMLAGAKVCERMLTPGVDLGDCSQPALQGGAIED